jgi:predicted ArsR family transcriptional regulator
MAPMSDEEAKKKIEQYLMDHPERPADEIAMALDIPQDQARRLMQDGLMPENAPETGKKTSP